MNLTILLFLGVLALFISGGIIYHKDHYAQNIHEENTCEVIASDFYQSRCSGARGTTFVCFRTFWLVTYSIVEDVKELRINARIEQGRFHTTAAAENRLNEYQVSAIIEQS